MNAVFPSQRSLTKAAKSSLRRGGIGGLLVGFLPAKCPFRGLKASSFAVDTHGSSDQLGIQPGEEKLEPVDHRLFSGEVQALRLAVLFTSFTERMPRDSVKEVGIYSHLKV